jgi:serine/threonine protein kinase
LYYLSHPHIIKLYGHFEEADHVYAIYDLMQVLVIQYLETFEKVE